MIIIGADYHPSFQQIAFVDTETGDYGEQRLQQREEARSFTATWQRKGSETAIENPYYIFIAPRVRRKPQRLPPNAL